MIYRGSEVTKIVGVQWFAKLFLRAGVGGQNFGKGCKRRGKNRVTVGKKDSADREIQKLPKTLLEDEGICAVLVGKEDQAVGSKVHQGIPHHQRPGEIVKKTSFAFACTRQGNGGKARGLSC